MSLRKRMGRLVATAGTDLGLETLEPRMLLSHTPLPSLGDMEDSNHTVVRIETNFGEIDIEMLDDVTPGTVSNFLNYVRDGDYDHTIFHRLDDDFVLQGGGFRFTDEDGATAIDTDAPIANEFNRSNLERTLAMAKLGGNPDSATSQFFVNLGDNSANLDSQNGGFTVFARILDDRSWNIIQTINLLSTQNFGGALGELPVTDDWAGDNTEETLVFINDVEIIKPAGTDNFYDEFAYYPEGFSGSTINEFLPLGNPNNEVVHYQVIARAEIDPADNMVDFDGWFRDRVIGTGTIQPNTRGDITISRFTPGTGAPNPDDLLPQGIPYSLEVHSTLPISANISHFDFGSATGESFTTVTDTQWAFGEAHRATSGEVFEFIVWQNPNHEEVNLTIDFFIDGTGMISRSFTTDAYRRGGLAFNNFSDLPDNSTFAMRVTADQDIVVALTQFGNAANPQGSTMLGGPGDPSLFGVLPMASVGAGQGHEISILNPNAAPTIVRLRATFTDGRSDSVRDIVVAGLQRTTFDVSTMAGLQTEDDFSLTWEAVIASTPVYITTTHTDSFTVDAEVISDSIGTAIPTSAADGFLFAEGFMDPGRAGMDLFETVSVFNPNSARFNATDTVANVTMRIFWADGFVDSQTVQVQPNKRVDLDLHTIDFILNRMRSDPPDGAEFFYSIEVTADVPIVAQMIHYDLTLGDLQPSGGFLTTGTPLGDIVRLDQLGLMG